MLVDCLLESVQRNPRRPAVGDPTRSLSYGQLATFARVIRRIVCASTDRPNVGVMLPASAGGLGTVLGTLWAGRSVVPLNFLLGPGELARIIADAGLDRVITTVHFESLISELPVTPIYLERLPLKRRFLWEKLTRCPRRPDAAPEDVAAIVYTSGSTGRPKGVCLTHQNLVSNCRAAIAHFGLDPDHHLLGVIPPFHVFGLTATTLLPIVLGATVTYIPRFSPQAVHRTVRDARISVMMAVPTMYRAIARLKDIKPVDFASVQLAVSGGEPLPRPVYDEVLARTGMILLEGYGMTETSPVISANVPSAHRVGSVGRPLPGVEVVCRDDEGKPASPGAEGELYVRGPLVMKGYYHNSEETRAVLDAAGWLRTGDIVRIDDAGFITITGRARDMMIVGGENVFPREIEVVLEQHPAVTEAAVLGRPDPSRGEMPVAFVVLNREASDEEATPEALRNFCRRHLAGFKVPRAVRVVEELPRGPTGKVLKGELAAMLDAS